MDDATRRDFFGVLATPLFRKLVPAVPLMRTEPSFAPGMVTSGYVQPLSASYFVPETVTIGKVTTTNTVAWFNELGEPIDPPVFGPSDRFSITLR